MLRLVRPLRGVISQQCSSSWRQSFSYAARSMCSDVKLNTIFDVVSAAELDAVRSYRGFCSILVEFCVMRSSALDRPDVLQSYS